MRPALITIFLVLILDQWLKLWIKASFPIEEHIQSFGFIELLFIENNGMAFGMEFGGIWGKMALSLFRVIAIGFIWYGIKNLITNKAKKGLIIATSLVFAGALGNLLDSLFYGVVFSESTFRDAAQFLPEDGGYAPVMMGKVVDMLHFTVTWPDWMLFDLGGSEIFPPIFNIADAAVSGGVITMLLFNKSFFGKGNGDFSIFKKKKDLVIHNSTSTE